MNDPPTPNTRNDNDILEDDYVNPIGKYNSFNNKEGQHFDNKQNLVQTSVVYPNNCIINENDLINQEEPTELDVGICEVSLNIISDPSISTPEYTTSFREELLESDASSNGSKKIELEGNVTPPDLDNTYNTSLFSCFTPFVNTISTPILRRSTQNNDTLTGIDITDKIPKINKILEVPVESEVTLPISSPSTITFESPMAEPSIFPCTTPIPYQISTPILTRSPISLNDSQTHSNESQLNTQGDIVKFKNLKDKHFNNPCLAYLNINSLRGDKFHELKEIIKPTLPEIVCIDETKLTSGFTTDQFHIEGYQYPPFRRDRIQPISNRSFGGGS